MEKLQKYCDHSRGKMTNRFLLVTYLAYDFGFYSLSITVIRFPCKWVASLKTLVGSATSPSPNCLVVFPPPSRKVQEMSGGEKAHLTRCHLHLHLHQYHCCVSGRHRVFNPLQGGSSPHVQCKLDKQLQHVWIVAVCTAPEFRRQCPK